MAAPTCSCGVRGGGPSGALAAVGMGSLPRNISVEVEAIVLVHGA